MLRMAQKLKVLYIDGSVGFGGAVKSLGLLLKGLSFVEPIVITYQYEDIIKKWFKNIRVHRFRQIVDYRIRDILARKMQNMVCIKVVKLLIFKIYALISLVQCLINLFRILRIARGNSVDLIHLNTGPLLEGFLAGKVLKKPCIVHLRGFVDGKDMIRIIRFATHVIGVSDAVSNSVLDSGISGDRVTTVYDMVDQNAFVIASNERIRIRDQLGFKEENIAVGIFGRVIPWKGQLEFVHAVLNVMKVNLNVKAVIVGDKSDGAVEYFDQIKDIIKSSGFKDHFIFTGYQENVEAYYFAMDIIVHASIDPEPFGMVIPEGMAAKKPVIATDAGGPREIIAPGLDGILVRPGDVKEMSSAILELANDPVKRQIMGLKGYNKVKERFNIQNIASQVEYVYQKLLSGSTAR